MTSTIPHNSVENDIARARYLLDNNMLPDPDAGGRSEWLKTIAALGSLGAVVGREMAREWSARGAKYNPRTDCTDAQFDGFNGSCTIASVFAYADANHPGWRQRAPSRQQIRSTHREAERATTKSKPSEPKKEKKEPTRHATVDKAVAALLWWHEKNGGRFVRSHNYQDATGKLVMVVTRFDYPDRPKQFGQTHLDGTHWINTGMPAPRPLFLLPELLAADPHEPVLVVEGERCAEALTQFAEAAYFAVTTSSQGAQNAALTDWTPLKGRRVVIVPDNDVDGRKYRDDVAAVARAAGAASVSVLELDGLGDGGDVVDWIAARRREGRTDAEIAAELLDPITLARELPAAPADEAAAGEASTDHDDDDDGETKDASDAQQPAGDAPTPGPEIKRRAKPLPDGLLSRRPPPRNYLLRMPTCDGQPAPPQYGDPWLPTGIVALLSSEGGTGKTTLAIALAVSVVLGVPWLGFHVDSARVGGRVFLLLAEEPFDEVWRRLWALCEAMHIDEPGRRLIEQRIVVAPMAGWECPLTESVTGVGRDGQPTRGAYERTSHYLALREMLTAGGPWALVVADPLARCFPEAEAANEKATVAIQACEAMTEAPGSPLVLVLHHSSKVARRAEAVDARGVSGLTDGARWAATLNGVCKGGGDVLLAVTKSNYSAPSEPVVLIRERGGLLRRASEAELQAAEDAAGEAITNRVAEDADKLYEAMRGKRLASKKDAAAVAGMRTGRGGLALDRLLGDGRVLSVGLREDRGPYIRADEAGADHGNDGRENGTAATTGSTSAGDESARAQRCTKGNAGTLVPHAVAGNGVPRSGVPGNERERGNDAASIDDDRPEQPGGHRRRRQGPGRAPDHKPRLTESARRTGPQ